MRARRIPEGRQLQRAPPAVGQKLHAQLDCVVAIGRFEGDRLAERRTGGIEKHEARVRSAEEHPVAVESSDETHRRHVIVG